MIEPLQSSRLVLETERLTMSPLVRNDIDLMLDLLCNKSVVHFVTGEAEKPEKAHQNLPNAVRRGAGGRLGIW